MGGAYNHPECSWQREHGLKRGNTMPIWGSAFFHGGLGIEPAFPNWSFFRPGASGIPTPPSLPHFTLLGQGSLLPVQLGVGVGVCFIV